MVIKKKNIYNASAVSNQNQTSGIMVEYTVIPQSEKPFNPHPL